MNKTKIPWANYTWNPIVGCSPASEGCANCYAAAISKRFGMPWGKAHFLPERLKQPSKIKKPSRVFVCSMADIFHPTVATGAIVAIIEVIHQCPQHTFILLTKRPQRLLELQLVLPGDKTNTIGDWFNLPNVWMGVTVENQEQAEKRLPCLMRTPQNLIRFVSVEPMLGPVTLRAVRFPSGCVENLHKNEVSEIAKRHIGKLNGIDWVIAGPETGPKARPCKAEWIDSLAAESLCFFDKRNSLPQWAGVDMADRIPLRREFPNVEAI